MGSNNALAGLLGAFSPVARLNSWRSAVQIGFLEKRIWTLVVGNLRPIGNPPRQTLSSACPSAVRMFHGSLAARASQGNGRLNERSSERAARSAVRQSSTFYVFRPT